MKRLLDILISLALFLLLLPLFLLIMLAIAVDSPGDIIFMQKRAGLYSRPFTMLKFRSKMCIRDSLHGREHRPVRLVQELVAPVIGGHGQHVLPRMVEEPGLQPVPPVPGVEGQGRCV